MVLGRKRKKTEKARESNAGAEPEAEQGLGAPEKRKEEARRGRKKGKVEGKRDSVYQGWLPVKERLRNVAKKVNYDESRDQGDEDDDEDQKRARKKRNLRPNAKGKKVQNQDMVKINKRGPKVSFLVNYSEIINLWLCFSDFGYSTVD